MFEIFQSEKSGKFYFRLKATNGQVILASEAYEKKAGAENGIQSVIKNAQIDERFARLESKNGDPYFKLKAANGQHVGKSEMYSSKAAMEKGIQSVKNNANSRAQIKDLTA
ncbi:MAG: YegP family protein [Saprospiraceae bacterium]|nr:YegP family protein [Saprospiraceae bacterium]